MKPVFCRTSGGRRAPTASTTYLGGRLGGLVLAVLASACSSSTPQPVSGGDPCAQAAQIIEDCGGEAPTLPPEGCVDSFRNAAEEIVQGGCGALDASGGKADRDGTFCKPERLWLGLCKPMPVEEAVAVPTLDDVCPASRTDDLCDALRTNDYGRARTAARALVRAEPRGMAPSDTALRYWLRERAVSLFVWNTLGSDSPGDRYAERADEVLQAHFPTYDPETISMARTPLAPDQPVATCAGPREALLIMPGVVRVSGRDEFAEHIALLQNRFPCLRAVLVDTGTFRSPAANAQTAKKLVDQLDTEFGPTALHFLGYSQGATNVLRTLVDYPELAARTRSVVTLNSAAHGSEVANLMERVLGLLGVAQVGCETWPVLERPLCEWAGGMSTEPVAALVELIAKAFGMLPEQVEQAAASEGETPAPTLEAFFEDHLQGVLSLTTGTAQQFWNEDAARLPQDAVYLSFRSIVTDRSQNLPASNALFFALLSRVDGYEPYNDMQLRLGNQSLGGPVVDREVVGRVAEGNHWQWALSSASVPEAVMPAEMADRTPDQEMLLAHYEALYEAGILLGEASSSQ